MKIVFFSFYYPPDLSAGSFRAVALSEALDKKPFSEQGVSSTSLKIITRDSMNVFLVDFYNILDIRLYFL